MAQNIHLREEQKEGWFLFAFNYVKIAELACSEMLNHKYGRYSRYGETVGQRIEKFNVKDLYIATIYNIKHAIEILLKQLRIELEGSYSEGHDSQKLLEELERCISFKSIEERQKNQLATFSPVSETDDEHTQDIKELLSTSPQELFEKFKKLVLKYHHLEFLKGKIETSYSIEDSQNEAFRYPVNGLTIQLKYDEISNKVTGEDITQIKKDIEELASVYLDFVMIILLTKR